MIAGIVVFYVLAAVIFPLVTLVHEAGHAVAALLFTRGRVLAQVGLGEPVFSATLGRMSVALGSRMFAAGFCRHEMAATRRRAAIIVGAGPLATLGLGVLAAYLGAWEVANGGPKGLQLLLGAVCLDCVMAMLFSVDRGVASQDGRDLVSDGEQLARLAGAVPKVAEAMRAKKTHPIAWSVLALVALLSLATVVVLHNAQAVAGFCGLLWLFGLVALAERRTRASEA